MINTVRSLLRTTLVALSLVLAATVASHVVAPTAAVAQQTANVTVTIILASNGGGGVDAGLRARESRLRSQFGQYNQFSLHARNALSLTEGQVRTINVPGGVSASVTLLSARDGNFNLQVQVTGGSTTVRSPQNSLFFVGGPSVNGQTLILMFET